MQKAKKIIFLILSLALSLSLFMAVGCGETKNNDGVDELGDLVISRTSLTLSLFETSQLAVYSDGENIQSASWSSSDPDTVSVTTQGLVKGESIGSANITATVGDKSLNCFVSVVKGDKIASLEMVDNVVILVGQSLNYTPEFLFDGEQTELPENITYTTTSTDKVELIKNADFSLTIKGKSKTDEPIMVSVNCDWRGIFLNKLISVIVNDDAIISLNKTALNLNTYAYGDKITQDVIGVDRVVYNGQVVNTPVITYTSEDTSVATVDQNGKVNAVDKGETFIKVCYKDANNGEHIARCGVKVTVTEIDFTNNSYGDIYKSSLDGNQEIDFSSYGLSLDGVDFTFADMTEEQEPFAIGSTRKNSNCWNLQSTDLVGGSNRIFLAESSKVKIKLSVNVVNKVIKDASDINNLKQYSTVSNSGTWKDTGKPVYTYDGYFVLDGNVDLGNEKISTNLYSTDTPADSSKEYGEYGFVGVFDGRGYTLYGGVYSEGGMFGSVGVNGVVKNFAIVNATLDRTDWDNNGHIMCCAIANHFMGTLENVLIEFTGKAGMGQMRKAIAQTISGATIKNVVIYVDESTATLATYIWKTDFPDSVAENVYVFTDSTCGICDTYQQVNTFKIGNGVTVYPYNSVASATDFSALVGDYWVFSGNRVRFSSYCEIENVSEYVIYTGLDSDKKRVNNTSKFNIDLTGYSVNDNYTVLISGQDITNGTSLSGNVLSINSAAFNNVDGGELAISFKCNACWIEIPVRLYTAVLKTADDIVYLQNYVNKTNQGVSNLEFTAGANNGTVSNRPYYSYGGYFVLGNSIDLSGCTVSTDFGIQYSDINSTDMVNYTLNFGFTGVFDGRGYALTGGTYSQGGLFGSVARTGVVKNLAITGATLNRVAWEGAVNNMCSTIAGLYFAGTMDNVLIDIAGTIGSGMCMAIAGNMAMATVSNTVVYSPVMMANYIWANNNSVGRTACVAANVVFVSDSSATNDWQYSTQFKNNVKLYPAGTACSSIDSTAFGGIWDFSGAKASLIPLI